MMIDRSIYIKKIGHRGHFKIWIVDGFRIRSEIDREFTNFAISSRFSFIPPDELWLDREVVPDERRFFIEYMLAKKKYLAQGMDNKKAIEEATKVERAEREKDKKTRSLAGKPVSAQLSQIRRQFLGKTKRGITIWVVDGKLVRGLFYIDFTEGGHHFVYDFVPEKEVWLDNDLVITERPYVLLHELFERSQMRNRGLTYNQAHRLASRLEWFCRHHPEKTKSRLAHLGWQVD